VRAGRAQLPVVENFYAYRSDRAVRNKLLRELRVLGRRLDSRKATAAQRRRLTRPLVALIKHAASELTAQGSSSWQPTAM
jgi:hypothetical protein